MKIKTKITAALIFALAILFAACGAPARAQDAGAAYVASYIEVAPPARTTAVYLLRALRDISRKEAGNTGFVVLQRIGQPQFAILESWSDAKVQAAHASAASAAQFRDKLKPYLAAPIDERAGTGFAVGQPKPSTASAVYAVTHVDLIGAKKDEGLAALKQLSIDSAKETGNLRFDVWQQGNRPNHLTVIEAWRNRAAFEAHNRTEHTRKFRDALLPMSGSLYDQRLYQAID
jgi:quinol monooxygenase YgiN